MKLLLYFAAVLLMVPAWGLMVTGSWRATWRYCKDWGRAVGLMVVVGGVFVLIAGAWDWLA